jgi:urea transporter/murein DD-endopeptidase MepM/ murein hydrolase activator NlpD
LRWVRLVLQAYAAVLFGRSAWAGLLFLAATLVVPQHGLAGLAGLVAANAWAWLLRRPAAHIADGWYGFNGLLVGLALGLSFRMSWTFLGLLVLVSLVVVVVAGALRSIAERYLGVPMLSMPFVLATWAALLAARRFAGVDGTVEPMLAGGWGAGSLPAVVELYLRSLAACFFQLSVGSGLLVLAGLVLWSRWAAVLSVLGFAGGYLTYVGLGGAPGDLHDQVIGFNFVLVAIAVGGVFVVLSKTTLLLAVAAGAMASVLSAAALTLLGPVGVPVLAMPFIVATQLLLFALVTRGRPGGPRLVEGVPGSPEENVRTLVHRSRRYPDPSVPLVFLPVMGRWRVTQGPDGSVTHQGSWSHAWDFEVDDDEGQRHRGDGAKVEDWYAFQAPVVAPADGRVVRVVDRLPDNAVGEIDTVNNWGNLVILAHVGGVYSALCHLQRSSVQVREGETVVRGQVLARVGNSGRSPVPHLHFQLQLSPEIGSPTCNGALLHYLRDDGSDRRYTTWGVPKTGDRIEAVAVDDAVRRSLALPPGKTWLWRATADGREHRETWLSTVGPLGQRVLATADGRTRAAFHVDDHYLTFLDIQGRGDTLLAWFALATARVPFARAEDLVWTDTPAATPFQSLAARLATEALLPFAPVGTLATRSRLLDHGGDVAIATEVRATGRLSRSSRLPDRIEVTFRPGFGPVRLRATRDGRELGTAEAVDAEAQR